MLLMPRSRNAFTVCAFQQHGRRAIVPTALRLSPMKSSFPPIVRADARVLILGSLPGEASLAAGQYYANPRNQFWRLIEAIGASPMPADYAARLQRLAELRIGLWDSVATAERAGSLDAAIRNPLANALADLALGLPKLRAIAFNGAAAAKIGRPALAAVPVPLIVLPSSSPAHAVAFETKAAAWRTLREYLQASGTISPQMRF